MSFEVRLYPNSSSRNNDGSYTADEIRRGLWQLNTDITCGHCGKVQPLAAVGDFNGPCCKCGKPVCGHNTEDSCTQY